MNKNVLIIVGKMRAGKSQVCEYLVNKYDFRKFTVSDKIREVARERGLEESRQLLQEIGDELRTKMQDPGAWIELLMEDVKLAEGENILFDSVKNPGEIERILKHYPNAKVLGVDAPDELRFQRVISGGKLNEPQTFQEFLERDAVDNGVGESDPFKLSNDNCLKIAEIIIVNDVAIDELHVRLDETINYFFDAENRLPLR